MKPTRINKFVAIVLGISRRKAEELIIAGRIRFNSAKAELTDRIKPGDTVFFDGQRLDIPETKAILIKLNKPVGYVCTHAAQGKDPSIFELLPPKYAKLKIIGRLDKNTSGLVLLTNNGDLAHQLMHPSFKKKKIYHAELSRDLTNYEIESITNRGVDIGDQRASKLKLKKLKPRTYEVILEEGRNRQIRRTFQTLGIDVLKLKRLSLGEYELGSIEDGRSLLVTH